MKELIPANEYGIFADRHDKARISSLVVAKVFGKEHKHVMRDIRELDCSEDFRQSNYGLSNYTDEQGKKRPCYELTKDGFTFLVMGYKGEKAANFKELYIKRFNEMEAQIQDLISARMDFPYLTDQIKLMHEDAKFYHYTNEFDMINRVAIGMTAAQFRKANNLKKGDSIRPFLTPRQIAMVRTLQMFDIGLITAVPDLKERKKKLEWYKAMIDGGKIRMLV